MVTRYAVRKLGSRRWSKAALVPVGAVVLSLSIAVTGHADAAAGQPWLNTHQGAEKRAHELLAAMTQADKIGFLTRGTVNPALGIPARRNDDGPNGLRGQTDVTAWPSAQNVAASFNTDLAKQWGTAQGQEAWGKGITSIIGPTINMARTPYWAREAETMGEDPTLSGDIAADEVKGMQAQHVIATLKHYVGNDQDTDRFGIPLSTLSVNDVVSERALQEIYMAPFRIAVKKGGAGSVMCSANRVNGEYSCANSDLLNTLRNDFGFKGYVEPDTYADPDPTAAFVAGMDSGVSTQALTTAVNSGLVSPARLDQAVVESLEPMFATGQFDNPNTGSASADVSTPAHQALAKKISEQASVLLKNSGSILPLGRTDKSIAVIGEDATPTDNEVEEGGSPLVTPTPGTVTTPLASITARAGSSATINYAKGTLGDVALPTVPTQYLTPSSGSGTGLTGTYWPTWNYNGTSVTQVDSTVDQNAACPPVLAGTCTNSGPILFFPSGNEQWSAKWTGTLTPPTTGSYRFSVLQSGQAKLIIDGKTVLSGSNEDLNGYTLPTTVPREPEQANVTLTAGHPVSIELDYQADEFKPTVQLGWEPPTQSAPMIADAVAAAKKSNVAVVFASQQSSEGKDRDGLLLPGDQDALIEAVAQANPNTVVVLHTPGPVLVPWLKDVKAVVEAWTPGQADGDAIAALLFGDANFSGRLPVTWPASVKQGPGQTPQEFPGVNNNVDYSEGIDIGYRYYAVHHQTPQFPFGYGLSYSTFTTRNLTVAKNAGSTWSVSAKVTNTSDRAGAQVVQLYVGDPASTGEPPYQLKHFQRVTLAAHTSKVLHFTVNRSDLSYWSKGHWRVAPGRYSISLGANATDFDATKTITINK
jgi:beta-glucosidase